MGRWDGSKFAENKRRREFLLLGIAGGAGVIALAALGVAKKGGGGGVSGTGVAPKIPFWSSSSTLGNSQAQYIAADPSISPTSDNIVDLGSLTNHWRSGFFGTTVNIDTPNGTQHAILFTQSGIGISIVANGAAIQLDGCPDLRPSGDNCADFGSDAKRVHTIITPTWKNTGTAPSGLTMQSSSFSLLLDDPGFSFRSDTFHTGTVDLGSRAVPWKSLYLLGASLHILGAASDANDTTTLKSGELDFGPGGATAVDTRITRTASGNISLTNSGDTGELRVTSGSNTSGLDFRPAGLTRAQIYADTSNFSVRATAGILFLGDAVIDPTFDNTSQFGQSSQRWTTFFASTGYSIFSVSGDVNPTAKLIAGELDFGPGGATAVDTYLKRIDANTLELKTGNLFRPNVDGTIDLGTSALRWRQFFSSSSYLIYGASGDAQPKMQLTGSQLQFGPGGSTVVDSIIARSGSSIFNITGTIQPSIDNSYNLGASTLSWSILYVRSIKNPSNNLLLNGVNSILFTDSSGNDQAGYDVANNTFRPGSDNTKDLGIASLGWRDLFLSGKIKRYNSIVTAAFGVPAIVAEGDSTGNTGTIASVAAYTVGAANGVFKVGGDLDVTAYTSGTINLQVTYTDWNNGAQTITIDSAGVLGDALGNEVTLMAKASTSITIKTTGTFVATYNVAATIIQVK